VFWSPLAVGAEAVSVAYQALKRKKRGATIVLVGAIIYFLAAFILFPPVGIKPSGPWFHLFYTTETLSLLIALSCYLAFEFAFTNQSLIQSLQKVKQLSEEKEQILYGLLGESFLRFLSISRWKLRWGCTLEKDRGVLGRAQATDS